MGCVRKIYATNGFAIKVASANNEDELLMVWYDAEYHLRVDEKSGDRPVQETFLSEDGSKVVKLYEYEKSR